MIKKPVSNNVSIPECPFAIANAPLKSLLIIFSLSPKASLSYTEIILQDRLLPEHKKFLKGIQN